MSIFSKELKTDSKHPISQVSIKQHKRAEFKCLTSPIQPFTTRTAQLTPDFLDACWEPLASDMAYIASRNAIATMDVFAVVQNRDVLQNASHVYSNKCSKESKCSTQRSSGRCWMFAMCNVMRVELMKHFKLPPDFELSQSFLFFYDKLERCNYFLESIIKTRGMEVSSRLVSHLNRSPLSDGGQWDMLVNIVQKYGICPKAVFPETMCCVASNHMNKFLTNRLRTCASELRTAGNKSEDELRTRKFAMMQEFHRVLATFFGKPPTHFNWEFRDTNKKFHVFKGLTPRAFYNNLVPFDINARISLIHDPRNEYYKQYTVEYLGNVVEGIPIRYINVPIGVLRAAVVASIDGDKPVWFGCDVGKSIQYQRGLLDPKLFDFKSAFGGIDFGMDKKTRLLYGESLMTHAMVFTAYDRKQNGAIRAWRVENSWGTNNADKGYLCMSDTWFDEWVYQVAVHRDFIDSKIVAILNEKAITLPIWDPMGALARTM